MTEQDRWKDALLPEQGSLQDAIRNLDQTALRIVLVVDENNRLQGTVSDGDIRRGLLKGLGLDESIATVTHRMPLVVPAALTRDAVMQLMVANKVQQIPVVDEDRRVIGLHVWDELSATPQRDNMMVIMAGGKGIRLRPHTENCPKPMLPVAGKPMLEHIIERSKLAGFSRFVISVNYLAHMIEDYFGDGSQWEARIEYLREDQPLGTAGALGLLSPVPDAPFVVTNGDVLTDINYSELLDFHVRLEAAATMAVRLHEWQHPYGVVHTRGIEIVGFEEKPIARTHINAGVYALNPDALALLPEGRCDMPVLFERLQAQARRTVAFPMHEPWLDVGRPEDYKQANTQDEMQDKTGGAK
ncbi:nucleotidyltransferase family protein [Laribacter hongkongensis]|uniref:nucleotidyltransferase family protein n=1 Tax=Laribacter hongkongensis TaxID=168471 RepID=UPI001EFDE1B9|nr:nucleotidyltransferase family protein [Laribacter hongkongensis]MCG8995492.1 nucleotidyltransferase family protein [Laribacter hongkongensis]MCG9010309.1 nucleotidyltransferase family protein [Laribacter hongkongensis]MCG9046203.1 nucleotidyltransferase family protein [Laribacter hongkongensis]MCG9051744.1 nucleotidyltransferase family protein [Laribacter hongkongensis]MCG9073775.1 nucleotidyltransferase family protein [Laribacter hongkongensis]